MYQTLCYVIFAGFIVMFLIAYRPDTRHRFEHEKQNAEDKKAKAQAEIQEESQSARDANDSQG